MADFLKSLKDAFGSKPAKASKSVDDPSNVVIDHPVQGFVVVPAEAAQRAGFPALLGIKPSQVPNDPEKRRLMTEDYRWAKAEREKKGKVDYSQAPSKRGKASAVRQVVVDDPERGLVAVDADKAASSGFTQMLGMKPESLPTDPTELAIATARVRARRDADEDAAALPPSVTRAMGGVDTVVNRPTPRIDAPPSPPVASPALAKTSAFKALQGLQGITNAPAPSPVAQPEPTLDVSPVGRAAAPALPRPLAAPALSDSDGAALMALANRGRPTPQVAAPQQVPSAAPRVAVPEPEEAVAPPSRIAAPQAAPTVARAVPPVAYEVEDVAPAPMVPQTVARPPAPAQMAAPAPTPSWDTDFAPNATGMSPEDSKALLAFAGAKGLGARAPSGAMAPSVSGSRFTQVPQGYAPTALPGATETQAPPAPDAALLAELRAAQRADGFSSGVRALGDQFRDAMNLILNRNAPPSRMADAPGGYVADFQQRQALAKSLEDARRANRLADATVAAKKNDAAKDEARLAKDQAAAASAAAKDNRDSPESKRVQTFAVEALRGKIPDAALAQIPSLSANEIEKVALKYGVSLANAETMAQLSGDRNDIARDNANRQAAVDAARLAQGWANLSLDQQRLLIQEETNKRSAAEKADEKVDSQTKDLQEAYDKAGGPQFYSKYDEASAIMSKYGKDLPGIGALDGRLPERLLSEDGRNLQGAVGSMLAEYRKGITGAGMSDSERVEYGQITGLLYSNSESAVRQGVERLKRAMDARVQSIAGGYKPSAVARYAGRVPDFNRAVLGQSERTTPTESMPQGKDGNPTLDATPPAPAQPRPALPTLGKSGSGVRTISVKGMKGGDLKASLAEGETVRYPLGGGKFQVVQKKDGRLLKLRVEDK